MKNEKELIERLNRNVKNNGSVKKIPVKVVKEEVKENNSSEEKYDCCGNCYDCENDCEFNETPTADHTCSYDKLKSDYAKQNQVDNMLIERMNKNIAFPESFKKRWEKLGYNKKEQKEIEDKLDAFDKDCEKVLSNIRLSKDISKSEYISRKLKEFLNTTRQRMISEGIKDSVFEKLLNEVTRFLCSTNGQNIISLIANNVPFDKWGYDECEWPYINKEEEKPSFESNMHVEPSNCIKPYWMKAFGCDKKEEEPTTEKVKETVNKFNEENSVSKEIPEGYKVFNFDRSKELIHKMNNLDKGLPLNYKEKTLLDKLTEFYTNRNSEQQLYTLDELLDSIKKSILKKEEIRDKKANEVWDFLMGTVETMKKDMEETKNNKDSVTFEDLKHIYGRYVDVWNLLYNEI
jgi:hypothetical protein